MKLAIVGSRTFSDYEQFKKSISDNYDINDIDCIISGGAKGADLLGKQFATENHIKLIEYLPEWDKYGKSAGFKRNELIWREADEGIAFWNGESKGTQHSFKLAEKLNKKIKIVLIDSNK